jgi:protein associated with RNAse G/E
MNELIRLTFRKFDGALHWHSVLRRLGEDEHGLWLGWGAGHVTARGSEPPITLERPYVHLIRREDWWCGTFNAEPFNTEIYCDITTVAEWTAPDEITLIDLDLDVLRLRDGRAPFIDDEDEFLEHQVRYAYPAEVIATARATADALLESVKANEEPFATAYHRWLALVADVTGDPGAA